MPAKIVFFTLVFVGSTSGFGEGEFVSSLIGRFSAAAKLQCVIDDYVREVVEEAKGVRVIYTDGVFDDDIRREAKRRGIKLEPIFLRGCQNVRSLVPISFVRRRLCLLSNDQFGILNKKLEEP